ncbi:hypothetical protein GF351_04920 [Candidatus Woesearchaeota archaeon]|nr:hypothetical protein [Candidatus Woesearchaeota archaeon]
MRKVCLSIGLLQPGDSRDVIVDVFNVILKSKSPLTSQDIEKKVIEERKKHKLPMVGIASSNIRRQIKRLKDLFLVEKVANKYRISEDADLVDIFDEKIAKFYLDSITTRVREYFEALQK